MYCSACGTQTVPDLSYCNRCGAILKTRSNAAFSAIIAAYLTAITVVALGGREARIWSYPTAGLARTITECD